MAAVSNLSLRFCSMLMAFHFALSAYFQLNDPGQFQLFSDWYFWFPLYAVACVVNLVNGVKTEEKRRKMAKFAVWLGMFLFIKVIIEDFVDEITGFWSFDMRERVVREKLGSGLVVGSMLMQLESLARPPHPSCTQVAKLGMPILVGISYSLSLFFFVFQRREMKF
ncbi:uncharacterized protein LOC111402608 isoform X1 [Olea europaea var. sylvestris]|uniref:uncharacterized protein LOC111402608 isoform X1 n=1 Tax=Olea europaea var. sylvestris TaxID=158386 RepID=UPI000C1CD45E|nr:uncharacterized protein LOC111402608 isoform X1 [Olea europaea var. sylvestris]